MTDIPLYKTFIKIEPIDKGWSSDKKYCIETADGEKLLMRVSDISEYTRKKSEFEIMQKVAALGIPMSLPIDFGICDNGKNVYSLLSWIDGRVAEDALPALPSDQQYELGVKAGQYLRIMHAIPASPEQEDWENRFNRKIDRNIEKYKKCSIQISRDDRILGYIVENRYLLKARPQSFQHGDYHVGNMVVSAQGELSIIDFNRFDYGDPWEEFNRIVWCAGCSKSFASGRIDGYFDGKAPEDFFRLLALYISSNMLSSIVWAIPFGQGEVETMKRQADRMLDDFDGMENPVPTWYSSKNS
ncbi:MAG TPA: phosphotransferase family protein [Clostridia bacterium]